MMKKVRKGNVMTIAQLREKLTKANHATSTCPLCSGIFAWLPANTIQELEAAGRKRVTLCWRTFTGKCLRKACHKIVKRGKR